MPKESMPKRGSVESGVKSITVSSEINEKDYQTWKVMNEIAGPLGLDLNDVKMMISYGLNHAMQERPGVFTRMKKIHDALEKANPEDRKRFEAYINGQVSMRTDRGADSREKSELQRQAEAQAKRDKEIEEAFRRQVKQRNAASKQDHDDMMGMLEG